MCLSTSSLQALEDKMRGAATVHVDQRVVVVLEWLVEGFGGVSKEF
jgi:hypothetical protein